MLVGLFGLFILKVGMVVCTHHSGFVTLSSITVPGAGFERPLPSALKNLALILFFTTTQANFGLKNKFMKLVPILNETLEVEPVILMNDKCSRGS